VLEPSDRDGSISVQAQGSSSQTPLGAHSNRSTCTGSVPEVHFFAPFFDNPLDFSDFPPLDFSDFVLYPNVGIHELLLELLELLRHCL
jgi:hypothetical protein